MFEQGTCRTEQILVHVSEVDLAEQAVEGAFGGTGGAQGDPAGALRLGECGTSPDHYRAHGDEAVGLIPNVSRHLRSERSR